MGALGVMATTEMSATTVYCEKVEVPMKCRRSWPLHLKREVPSGMTPLPWVARMAPQRLVLPERQNLQAPHSGVLLGAGEGVVSCGVRILGAGGERGREESGGWG